jgi:hypothetical protein
MNLLNMSLVALFAVVGCGTVSANGFGPSDEGSRAEETSEVEEVGGAEDDTGDNSDTGTDSDTGSDSDPEADADTGGTDSDVDSDPPREDYDGDGFVADNDCDETDPAIHAYAEEVCGDGLDNDCDGQIDEVAYTFYPDGDEDGYGDSDASIEACEQPSGTVMIGGDCDDNDNDVYPGAEEVADGDDNDCDGEVDEDSWDDSGDTGDTGGSDTGSTDDTGDSGETGSWDTGSTDDSGDTGDTDDSGADTGENGDTGEVGDTGDSGEVDPDEDGDGYGASEDCDDADADVNPGAMEIEDGVDNDCDSVIPEPAYWEDVSDDGNVDAICFNAEILFGDVSYSYEDALTVGYGLFDWSISTDLVADGGDLVEVESNGFHCIDFSSLSVGSNVEFTMVSSVDSAGDAVDESSSLSDLVWHQLYDACSTAVSGEIFYDVCSLQSGTDYLIEVDWDGTTLSASGDNS